MIVFKRLAKPRLGVQCRPAGRGIFTHAVWQKGSMFEEGYFIPGKKAGAE